MHGDGLRRQNHGLGSAGKVNVAVLPLGSDGGTYGVGMDLALEAKADPSSG